jgi:hypothetical protein
MNQIDWNNSQFPIPYPLKRSRGVYERLDELWKEAQSGDQEAIEKVIKVYARLIKKKQDS